MMFEYEVVEIDTKKKTFDVFFDCEEIRKTINAYARDGYQLRSSNLVHFNGYTNRMILILERKID
ncbi:MAG: DUF4177 domain-containing protein [Oscillospiraceae bacterium]|nr:DUF4177 domain-containing protein [Oscillospiraceae bacterium]